MKKENTPINAALKVIKHPVYYTLMLNLKAKQRGKKLTKIDTINRAMLMIKYNVPYYALTSEQKKEILYTGK